MFEAIKSGKSTLVQFLLKTGISLTDFVKDNLEKLYYKVVICVLCPASWALPWCSSGNLYSHGTIFELARFLLLLERSLQNFLDLILEIKER